jgi:hypothetical protein
MTKFGIVFWICLWPLAVGCNESPYELAPVRGKVTIDGQPMTSGRVLFAPVAQGGEVNVGKPAFGHIQSDGSFVLRTYTDGDGAVVGNHWVTIYNVDTEAGDNASPPAGNAPNPTSNSVRKWKFEKITFPRTTVSVVTGEKNNFAIELTSQDVARFGT